jgi:AmmeMemoRadiSam system protein B
MYTRKAAFAGSFYPANSVQLHKMLDLYIPGDCKASEEPLAIIVPHAGYIYSGHVAGRGYAAVSGFSYKRVIILSPSHRARFHGVSVMPEGEMMTPLGAVRVDSECAGRFTGYAGWLRDVDEAEHALEVQLPFIRKIMPDALVVPMIIGSDDAALCSDIAGMMYRELADDPEPTLVVVSTDLSHYHDSRRAGLMDRECIRLIAAGDIAVLREAIGREAVEACGIAGIYVVLEYLALRGGYTFQEILYAHSGETSGDNNRVVGYLTAAFMEKHNEL